MINAAELYSSKNECVAAIKRSAVIGAFETGVNYRR